MKVPRFFQINTRLLLSIGFHGLAATLAGALLGIRPTEYLLWVILAELLALNGRLRD